MTRDLLPTAKKPKKRKVKPPVTAYKVSDFMRKAKAIRNAICKSRDALRDLIDEYDEVICDSDDAVEAIDAALEALGKRI